MQKLCNKFLQNSRLVNTAIILHGSGLVTSWTDVKRIQSCLFRSFLSKMKSLVLTCDCESCTMSLATSWSTSIILRMVAPSLVTVTSLSEDTIILSRPLGPSDVRSVLATVLAAWMCDCNAKEVKLQQTYESILA